MPWSLTRFVFPLIFIAYALYSQLTVLLPLSKPLHTFPSHEICNCSSCLLADVSFFALPKTYHLLYGFNLDWIVRHTHIYGLYEAYQWIHVWQLASWVMGNHVSVLPWFEISCRCIILRQKEDNCINKGSYSLQYSSIWPRRPGGVYRNCFFWYWTACFAEFICYPMRRGLSRQRGRNNSVILTLMKSSHFRYHQSTKPTVISLLNANKYIWKLANTNRRVWNYSQASIIVLLCFAVTPGSTQPKKSAFHCVSNFSE